MERVQFKVSRTMPPKREGWTRLATRGDDPVFITWQGRTDRIQEAQSILRAYEKQFPYCGTAKPSPTASCGSCGAKCDAVRP